MRKRAREIRERERLRKYLSERERFRDIERKRDC